MKTKNYFLSLAIAFLLLFGVSANAQLIIYEPASNAQAGGTYTGYDLDLVTPKTAPLPTGGLTATDGLPATNSGGNPTGTSTGLRNTWGADVKVVTGLTYANSGGTLSTTGNALNSTASSWGAGNPFVYRWMTTDPFINSRIGGATNGNFGYNAAGSNVLYFSALLNTSDITATSQFMFKGAADLIFDLYSSQWRFDSQNLGAAVANTTAFVVVKFTFTSAAATTIEVWFNPTLGAALGTATKTITKASGSSISGLQFRNGNSKLTVDEIRFGLTASDVMPVVPAPSAPTALSTTAVANNSLTLNWTASATSGVTYEIFKNGTSIGSVGTGVTTYNVTGLTAGTVYAFTVKALKDAVYSAASTAANVRTTNPGVSELLVYEPADNTVATGSGAAYTGYNLNATNPLPSANNAANGLPATNVGGNPSGTSTGLRNGWGDDIQVVNGLTYSNAGGSLSTTGNALMHTGSNYGSSPAVYRWMTTDPYATFRSSASDQVFGWNNSYSTTIYFSVLLNVNDLANVGGTTAKQFQIKTLLDGNSGNSGGVLFQQNTTGSNWELFLGGTSKGVLGTAVANQTEFIVGSFEFTSASSTTVKVWFNPTLGAALGTPTQQFNVALAGNIQTLAYRSGNGKLIADEFRLGLKESDVMPARPSAPTITAITPGNTTLSVAFTAGATGGSAITNYKYSTDGGGNWTLANTTTSPVSITGLSNGVSYNVQLKAVNANGDGAATASTSATTTAISGVVTASSLNLTPSSAVQVSSGAALNIDNNQSFGSITVAQGGKLTISNAPTLSGSLILESTSNGTATLVDDYTTPTVSATVKQYVTAGRNWYLSPAVTTAGYGWLNLGTSVQEWNEATKAWVIKSSGTLTPGKGYVQVATSTPSVTGTTGIVNVTGTTNSGNVSVTVTRTESGSSRGFNLVGNPYPSYLNWDNFYAESANAAAVLNSFWFRTQNNSNQYVFTTYNGASHTVVGATTVLTDLNNYIPPMQAFWVRVKQNLNTGDLNYPNNSASITFKNNMRGHIDAAGNTSNNKFKVPKADERRSLRLQLVNGTQSDESLIYFDAAAANTFDDYDSPKMLNNNSIMPDLYSLAGTERLAINGLAEVADNMELPLGFTLKTAATGLKLKVSELSNFVAGTKVYLLDKEQNTKTELQPETEYTFDINASTTNNENRFSLRFRIAGSATGVDTAEKQNVHVFVNAANQFVINAPEKSNYAIYNALGMIIENGVLTSNSQTSNVKPSAGIYVVKVGLESKRVIIN